MDHIQLIARQVDFPRHGDVEGICRITGIKGTGVPFVKWVKKTFTDWAYLHEGDIISNEAAFCFCELSPIMQEKTGRDKPQNFRTYSHIITKDDDWLCLTKADKKRIVGILQDDPKVVCLTDTGQKHLYFKHRDGFWQLDELHILPDLKLFNAIHSFMMQCIEKGYNQNEIKTGDFKYTTIKKIGMSNHIEIKEKLETWRGQPIFDFAAWLMYSINKV